VFKANTMKRHCCIQRPLKKERKKEKKKNRFRALTTGQEPIKKKFLTRHTMITLFGSLKPFLPVCLGVTRFEHGYLPLHIQSVLTRGQLDPQKGMLLHTSLADDQLRRHQSLIFKEKNRAAPKKKKRPGGLRRGQAGFCL